MLQKYDTTKSISLLALAAAGGFAFTAAAQTVTPCTPTDGYEIGLSSFVAEAEACLAGAETFMASYETELLERINKARTDAGLTELALRDGLTKAARAHSLDMAEREYAAHTDPEGRDHMFRARAFDRTVLIASSGAAVLQTGLGADAGDVFVLMIEDPQNDANIMNEAFTHVGFGMIRSEDSMHVTVVFAEVSGELSEPLPLKLAGFAAMRPDLLDRSSETLAWGLTDQASGELLAKGSGSRIAARRLAGVDMAELDVLVETDGDLYTLKGPLVSAR